jgi:hypothetical protein
MPGIRLGSQNRKRELAGESDNVEGSFAEPSENIYTNSPLGRLGCPNISQLSMFDTIPQEQHEMRTSTDF